MEALTKIPKITSLGEVKKLRSLCDVVESHVRGLEGMKISPEMYSCFLTPLILQKLPDEFRIAIIRNLGSDPWELKDILSEFHKQLLLREQCLINIKESKPSNCTQNDESVSSTSALLNDSDRKNNQVSRVWCSLSNQDHRSAKCNVVTNPESRKQIL